MNARPLTNAPQPPRRKASFAEDFRRFFVRGLAALLPTLITLWLLVWMWDFLWDSLGQHIIWAIIAIWYRLVEMGWMEWQPLVQMRRYWWSGQELPLFVVKLIGVGAAVLLVYAVGLLVGNLIGRTLWRIAERGVMRIPLVRAIYPAVKQVTDFLLADRKATQFESSRVVAVHARDPNVWSIGLVTGPGLKPLVDAVGSDMVTVFIPSSPTAFSGYVVVVPREAVVELPLKVEEAMRMLISGGVVTPPPGLPAPIAQGAIAQGAIEQGAAEQAKPAPEAARGGGGKSPQARAPDLLYNAPLREGEAELPAEREAG